MISQYQLDRSGPAPVLPFPPQPEHCLYFYPKDRVICRNYSNDRIQELPRSILVGPQLSRVDLTMGYHMLVIMVGFQPGGMHRLLRLPMEEMLDRPVDARLILGKEIETITEQLDAAPDHPTMLGIIQQYLLGKMKVLKTVLPVEQVLVNMLRNGHLLNVDQLARESCVSVRQLERQFRERTGLTPKLYSRLVRFSRAWIMREKNAGLSWLHIAHACAYADQMHMIRDFKYFAGVTPGILQSHLEKTDIRLQASTFD
jgi:AraC-like DNA-binding protein